MTPETLSDLPEVMTVIEVARYIRCGRNQIYELVRRGEIHSCRVGTSIRIPRWALIEFMQGPIVADHHGDAGGDEDTRLASGQPTRVDG